MVRAAVAQRHAQTMDVLASDVGLRIRKARHERGMTLAAVGGEDLSRSFLSAVESGRSRISLRALAIVGQRLDLPLSYFLQGQDESRDVLSEWTLNQAESELDRQQPAQSLRLLHDLEVPGDQRVRLLWIRGRALGLLGQTRGAIATFHEALPLIEKGADKHQAAEVRQALGTALCATERFDEALVHLRQALDDVVHGAEDPALTGKITASIGHVYFVRGQVNDAITHYQRALEQFGKVRDYYTQGDIYSGLSSAYQQQGDLQAALRYSRLSAATFRASNNLRNLAAEINNVAVRYQELDDLDRAQTYAREAVERAREIHAGDLEATAHGTLAAIYVKQGDLAAAEHEAEAAETSAPGDATRARIEAWRVLADIAAQRGEDDRADELYRRVLEALKESPHQGVYARTALAYSELLRRRGQTDRALDLAYEVARLQVGGR